MRKLSLWTKGFLLVALSIPAIGLGAYLLYWAGGCTGGFKGKCEHISYDIGINHAAAIWFVAFWVSLIWTPVWLCVACIAEYLARRRKVRED